MNICFLCADPGVPVFGRKGCSTHVRETCLTLIHLGHDVRLVCSNVEGDDADRANLTVVEVTPLRSKKLGFDLRHVLVDRRMHKAAEGLFRQWRPDAIYERYSLYSQTGIRLARKYRLPHLMEINAFMTHEQKNRIKLMPWARSVERRIFERARHVVVVSEPLREEVAKFRGGAETITRMPMAVDLSRFSPDIDGTEVRTRLGLDGRFVIGYVGTLTGWHGIKLLYDLARRLEGLGMENFTILVVGGDDKRVADNRRRVAEEGFSGKMKFIGPVPHRDVPSHIRAMDVALVPDTTYWSSPAKLFEYQGCGIPVLAPRYPAIEAAMDHRREGWLFTPCDVEEMARGAYELHKDPEARREIGARARERAAQDHSWESLGQNVTRILEEQASDLGRGGSPPGASLPQ